MLSSVGHGRSQVLFAGVVFGMLFTVGIVLNNSGPPASAGLPGTVIADFLVLRDSSFSIRGTESKPIEFDLPADADLGSMAVLAYVVRTSEDTQDLALEIQLNGNRLDAPTFRDRDIPRGLWETFKQQDGQALKLTGNVLEFKITGGTGGVSIRDVVLWYHRVIP